MKIIFFVLTAWLLCFRAIAQDNYEIQVYGSSTTEKGSTMVELHSNYTLNGTRVIENNVLPSNHVFHETIEVTHGFSDCFEIGYYIFNAIGSMGRTNFVGSHIRPRIRLPQK